MAMFDFNGDGKMDGFELFAGLQMTATSREEAINLTGDDTFYLGDDKADSAELKNNK